MNGQPVTAGANVLRTGSTLKLDVTNPRTTITVNGLAVSTPHEMIITGDVVVVGVDAQKRNITLSGGSASDVLITRNGATISAGTQVVEDGDTVSISLTSEHATMTVNGVSRTSPYVFTVSENISIVLTLPTARNLSITGTGAGDITVTRNGSPVSAGTGVIRDYDVLTITSSNQHTTITLNGTSTDLPVTNYTVNANVTIVATAPTARNLTVTGSAPSLSMTRNGVAVTAGTGKLFDYDIFAVSWTGRTTATLNGNAITSGYTETVNQNISIAFTAPTKYTLSNSGTGAGNIKFTMDGTEISAGANVLENGATLIISRTDGYTTVTVNGTTQTLPYTMTVSEAVTVVATSHTPRNLTLQSGTASDFTMTKNGNPVSFGSGVLTDGDLLNISWTRSGTVEINGTQRTSPYSTMVGSDIIVKFTAPQAHLHTYGSYYTATVNGTEITLGSDVTLSSTDTVVITPNTSAAYWCMVNGEHKTTAVTFSAPIEDDIYAMGSMGSGEVKDVSGLTTTKISQDGLFRKLLNTTDNKYYSYSTTSVIPIFFKDVPTGKVLQYRLDSSSNWHTATGNYISLAGSKIELQEADGST